MTYVIHASPELTARLIEQQQLEDSIATLEEQLSEAKAQHKQLSENLLPEVLGPDAFDEDVVIQVDPAEGHPDAQPVFVTAARKHHCGINNADKTAAHLWLEEHGHGQLLKRYVTLALGKDSRQMVAKLDNLIKQLLPHFTVEIVVPPRGDQHLKPFVEYLCAEAGILKPDIDLTTELPGPTLASWVKKQLAKGEQLPSFFNVFTPVKLTRVPAPDPATVSIYQRDGQWYHRDESDGGEHGPFETIPEAETALAAYIEFLNTPAPVPEPVEGEDVPVTAFPKMPHE